MNVVAEESAGGQKGEVYSSSTNLVSTSEVMIVMIGRVGNVIIEWMMLQFSSSIEQINME